MLSQEQARERMLRRAAAKPSCASDDESCALRGTVKAKNGTKTSYAFHVSHPGIDGDAVALDLTKRMLRAENAARLAETTIALYAQSQEFEHKVRLICSESCFVLNLTRECMHICSVELQKSCNERL